MSYFNVLERIRKTAGMPAMNGGVPDKDHRKASDWAAFTHAVDVVTDEIVGELLACKERYASLASASAEKSRELAGLRERLAQSEAIPT